MGGRKRRKKPEHSTGPLEKRKGLERKGNRERQERDVGSVETINVGCIDGCKGVVKPIMLIFII